MNIKGALLSLIVLSVVFQAATAAPERWVCTRGKDPLLLNVKEYMKAFAAGPCSPAVLVPGILASVLRVEITDCELFRLDDPETFGKCGWKSCTSQDSPKREYQLWVTEPLSPMTILNPSEASKECFAGLIEVSYDAKSGKFTPVSKPGIRVTPKGYSSETSGSVSKCGLSAIENLIPDIPNPEETEYFKLIIQKMTYMGYKSGLTLQALPYDFRLSSGQDLISKNLINTLNLMKQFTNKRAIIIAHSMGNTKVTYAFWNMLQSQKDNLIELYLALGPPLLGSAKPVSYLTCGSNEFAFLFNIGIDMKTWKRLAGSFGSIFELLPQKTFLTQADQLWMKKIMARVQYELGKSDDPVFDFLPKREYICFKNFDKKNCLVGFEEFDNYATTYLGERISNKNLLDWMTSHSFSKLANKDQMYSLFDKRFETLPNINVPSVFFYTSVVPTEGKFHFHINPQTRSRLDEFCSKKDFSWLPWQGDDTVPAISALTPAMKWAQEFSNGTQNAKPLKIVNICSSYNIKDSPYDEAGSQGRLFMNRLDFQGIPCDCSEGKYRHCTHLGMLYNPDLVDYVANSLVSHEVQPISQMVEKMTETQLKSFMDTCQLLQSTYGNAASSESETVSE